MTRTLTIAEDDRARVPFALIGVLVLLTSATIVGVLSTRPESPDPGVNTARAVATTQGSVQSTVRGATRTALKDAATEPMTETSDTFVGEAIDGGDESAFRRYVKLKIYLSVQRQLASLNHSFRGGVRTDARLPGADPNQVSLENAIDAVSLEPGIDTPGVDPGNVVVNVSNIWIDVTRNGERTDRVTTTVNVTVPSTLFISHRKAQTYREQLNKEFAAGALDGEADGLGNKLALRLYLLTYFKELHDRIAPRIKYDTFNMGKILPPKEVAILANGAIRDVQRSVFGTIDPDLDRYMAAGYFCLFSRIGMALWDSYGKSGSPDWLSKGNLCSIANIVAGDAVPQTVARLRSAIQMISSRILGGSNPLAKRNRQQDVKVNEFVHQVYQQFAGNGGVDEEYDYGEWSDELADNAGDMGGGETSLGNIDTDVPGIIDSVYTVDTWGSMDAIDRTGSEPDIDPSPGENWTRTLETDLQGAEGSSVAVSDVRRWSSPKDSSSNHVLYQVEVTYTNHLYEKEKWVYDPDCGPNETCPDKDPKVFTGDNSTITFTTTIYVRGDYSTAPNAAWTVSSDYVESGRTINGMTPHNMEPAVLPAINGVFGTGPDSAPAAIEDELDGTDLRSGASLRSSLSSAGVDTGYSQTHDLSPPSTSKLREWLLSELQETAEDLNETIEPLRITSTEMVTRDEVFSVLEDRVAEAQSDLVYAGIDSGGPYADLPQKALVKLRRDYILSVRQRLLAAEEQRENQKENDQMGDVQGKLSFAQSVLSRDSTQVSNGTFEDPSLVGDVKYSVETAPTYLTITPVNRLSNPAIGPTWAGPENPTDTAHAPLAIKSNQEVGEPGFPVLPLPQYWYVSMNYWAVDVTGEYARVEITSTLGDTSTSQSTTYVRQAQPVRVTIDGQEHLAGQVEPIEFSTDVEVIGAIPGLLAPPSPTGIPLIGRKTGKPANLCTVTWDQVGPGVSPQSTQTADCAGAGGGGMFDTIGELSTASSKTEFLLEAGDEFEDYAEEDVEPCTEDTFEDTLTAAGGGAEDWYDDVGPQRKLWTTFCSMSLEHQEQFVTLIADDDGDWREVVVRPRITRTEIKETVRRVVRYDLDDDHDIEDFKLAREVNTGVYEPHEAPGIVIAYETGREVSYRRAYDPEGGPSGGWFAPASEFENKDRKTIIRQFALLDEGVVQPDSEAWGDYRCAATVDVPEGTTLWMSTANGFAAEAHGELQEDLPGGITQVKAVDDIPDDRYEPDGSLGEDGADDATCPSREKLEVTFVDVGTGQAIFIQNTYVEDGEVKRKNMLVDVGDDEGSVDFEDIDDAIEDETRGETTTIHNLVVTHNHEDHAKYVETLQESDEYVVQHAWWSGVEAGNSYDAHVTDFHSLGQLAVGDGDELEQRMGENVEIEVYNPPSGAPRDPNGEACGGMGTSRKKADCNAVVIKITYRPDEGESKSFLLAGDIRGNTKQALLDAEATGDVADDVTVLQVSHHGVESGLTPSGRAPLLRKAEATGDVHSVVISNNDAPEKGGDDDMRHTASKAVLCTIDDYSVETYWTGLLDDGGSLHGTIEYTATADDLTVTTESGQSETDASALGTMVFDDFDCSEVDSGSSSVAPDRPTAPASANAPTAARVAAQA